MHIAPRKEPKMRALEEIPTETDDGAALVTIVTQRTDLGMALHARLLARNSTGAIRLLLAIRWRRRLRAFPRSGKPILF
jgi:hypothetical protein